MTEYEYMRMMGKISDKYILEACPDNNNKNKRKCAECKNRKRKMAISIPIAACIMLAIFVYTGNHSLVYARNPIKQSCYLEADLLESSGRYLDARNMWLQLDGYRDSKERAEKAQLDNTMDMIRHAKIGEEVFFGRIDGVDLTWIVLEKSDEGCLLISKNVLNQMSYASSFHEKDYFVWEESDIRFWLNGEFYDETFSESEKACIDESYVTNHQTEASYSSGGNDTKDKVYLLSDNEVALYFPEKEDRYVTTLEGTKSTWWLRTQGESSIKNIKYIDRDGTIDETRGSWSQMGVRPVLYLEYEPYE